MPVYTYRCGNCGVQFDQTQKFIDDPLTKCPECGKNTLQKVYSPVGIVFKGSGFYATDHRSPSGMNYASDKKKDSAPETKTETSSPSETTPAKPAETAKPATAAASEKS